MWFKRVPSDYCGACQARMAHLDDLRDAIRRLEDEKSRLLNRFIGLAQPQNQFIPPELNIESLRARKTPNEDEMRAQDEATKNYWARREQAHKDLNDEIKRRIEATQKEKQDADTGESTGAPSSSS